MISTQPSLVKITSPLSVEELTPSSELHQHQNCEAIISTGHKVGVDTIIRVRLWRAHLSVSDSLPEETSLPQ